MEINDCMYSQCIVIGIGGTGSQVVDVLLSIKQITSIAVIDDDIIEMSNLNRTPFSYDQIGKKKVDAIMDIALKRNASVQIIPIDARLTSDTRDEILTECLKYNSIVGLRNICVFDCRDDDFRDQADIESFIKMRLQHKINCRVVRPGYDGMSITIDPSPKDHPSWGVPGYNIIPSHGISSRLAALFIVYMALYDKQTVLLGKCDQKGIPLTASIEQIIQSAYVDYMFNGSSVYIRDTYYCLRTYLSINMDSNLSDSPYQKQITIGKKLDALRDAKKCIERYIDCLEKDLCGEDSSDEEITE